MKKGCERAGASAGLIDRSVKEGRFIVFYKNGVLTFRVMRFSNLSLYGER